MLFVFLALLPLASGFCSDSWPNGTAHAVNFWNCPGGLIKFVDVETFLTDGQTHTYPISFQSSLLLKTKIVNNGHVVFSLQSTMSISTLEGSDVNSCYWSTIPTYGSLNDRNSCSDSVKCPVNPGIQDLDIVLDFTKTSPATLQMLPADSDVQIQYTLLDYSMNVQACLMMQMRMTHK